MISGRAYSGFMDESQAVAKLQEEAELFDPEILKAFVKAHECGALTPKTGTGGNLSAEKVHSAKAADNPEGEKVTLLPTDKPESN